MNTSTKQPPEHEMKVGIWCAYHITLGQSEGIGVFAHNLARGLANLGSDVTVTMVAKPGDEALMADTVKAGNGRIYVRTARPLGRYNKLHKKFHKIVSRNALKIERSARKNFEACNSVTLKQHVAQTLRWVGLSPTFTQRRLGKFTRAVTYPLLCAAYAGSRLRLLAWKKTILPSTKAAENSLQVTHKYETIQEEEMQRIIDSCDVWVLPYVGLERHFSKPTVVTIHDLVCYHFPEVLDARSLSIFKRLAEAVSARSTISACMSNVIRDSDLYGILKLPEHKVRVVQPAAPSDFGTLADPVTAAATYPILQKKYIFYPSAFRSYKNHELLVKAMQRMRAEGHDDLHLVFTGIHAPPRALADLIKQCGVKDRVHVLGKVQRDVLSLLYRKAFATFVSSRYEQGSFPLMEAMYWECPIACSRIPSLTELFEPMGSTMHYFDTDDVSEVVRVMHHFLQNRESVLRAQQSKRQAIFGRSWTDAAADWRNVFEYAIELHEREHTAAQAQNHEAAA